MLMGICILENGLAIGLMEKGFIPRPVVHATKENGGMTNSMGSEFRLGQMRQNIVASIVMGRKMERESSDGTMIARMMVSSARTISMDMVSTHGRMGVCMKDNGRTIKWMVKEYSLGSIIDAMRVNMSMTKRKVLEYLHSRMDVFMKDNG